MAAVVWAVLKFWLYCLCKWSRLSSVACAVFGQSWQWQILTTNVTPLNRVEEQTFYSKSGRKHNIFTQHSVARINITSSLHLVRSRSNRLLILLHHPSIPDSGQVPLTRSQSSRQTIKCLRESRNSSCLISGFYLHFSHFVSHSLYPIIPSSCSITQKSSHGAPTKKFQRGFCTTAY